MSPRPGTLLSAVRSLLQRSKGRSDAETVPTSAHPSWETLETILGLLRSQGFEGVSGADHEELIEALQRWLPEAAHLEQAITHLSDTDVLQALTFQEGQRAYVMFLLNMEPVEPDATQSNQASEQQNDRAEK